MPSALEISATSKLARRISSFLVGRSHCSRFKDHDVTNINVPVVALHLPPANFCDLFPNIGTSMAVSRCAPPATLPQLTTNQID